MLGYTPLAQPSLIWPEEVSHPHVKSPWVLASPEVLQTRCIKM